MKLVIVRRALIFFPRYIVVTASEVERSFSFLIQSIRLIKFISRTLIVLNFGFFKNL